MLMAGYDVAKAAQAVAYFAMKSGGKINVLKLSKLLYLAEREYMKRYDEPMFFDNLSSMPDGPVVSITLNFINGSNEDDIWGRFVAPRQGYDIAVASELGSEDLEDLSIADIEILDHLWSEFGGFDKYALRDWTHKSENIPEWKDPNGSSTPIQHLDVFGKLGKSDPASLVKQMDARRRLAQDLANLE